MGEFPVLLHYERLPEDLAPHHSVARAPPRDAILPVEEEEGEEYFDAPLAIEDEVQLRIIRPQRERRVPAHFNDFVLY
jgi:hypothetical protein